MKVRFIDTLCTNGMHLLFNASLLAILEKIFDKISLYGEKNNINDEIKILEENGVDISKIERKNIYLPIVKSRISNFFLYLCSFFYNLYFIVIADKDDILVFNYNNLLAVRMMNIFNKIFHRKILIFCHGEMEFLIENRPSFGPFNRFTFYLGKCFFLNKKIRIEQNIKFVVLGDSILKNVKEILPLNISKSFITMDHSYFFKKDDIIKEKVIKTENIKIGTVGLFYRLKGADDFCKLVSSINNKNIEFSITGKILYDVRKLQELGVSLPENLGKDVIPRDILEKRIEDLDFILYLYPITSYKIMASGAILDALSFKRPIIALRNDYFSYIFEKFGEFGYLFDSLEDIINFLNQITLFSIDPTIFDYKMIQQRLSIDFVSKTFREELESISFFN
ncbi:glycosyltransferase family 1 protein [Capnocytophaga leadbetteri]|uniref:glycosyltransferase family 1 protein n=1 Tax=Capnocytophaga leadbetteri TaxID=327575 RepID=UPI0028E384BC|nr:glycosyltransferase family 1 protein [Capnocytophaga leadbetteri]